MAERADAKPTPRVVLMEFEVNGMRFATESLSEEDREALKAQLGIESDDVLDRPVQVLIPVARAAGGPKAVIEAEAKTRGRFRAIAQEAFDQGHEAIPPEQQRFELRPLKAEATK
jgi:hypothetical protein